MLTALQQFDSFAGTASKQLLVGGLNQKHTATLPVAFLDGEPAITVGRRWLVVEAETDNRKGSFSQPARLSEQPSQRTR